MTAVLVIVLLGACASPGPAEDEPGLSGDVYFFEFDGSTWMSGSFVVGSSTWTPVTDGACESGFGDMHGETTTEVSAGDVDYYVGGVENVWTWPPPAPGATFGARAEGDVFPAFDLPDALDVPYALDLAWPDDLSADSDFVLSWPGPYADRVTIGFNFNTNADTWDYVDCTFVDDGTATIPAAALTDVVSGRPTAYAVRSSEWATTIEGASLLFQATSGIDRSYRR